MFSKILIANRGEIACRIARTARAMGVRTVAVYSAADANALHVRSADEAFDIGAAPARASYLRGEAIIAAAIRSGAEAVHPGYGFLSENDSFAEACAAAGLVFIGPPAAAIRAMGSKSAAKELMQRAGVPLVPGYHGARQDLELLQAEADRIGYPVLIKASAGGGGKGMRRVAQAADFAAALAACQREAAAGFGDARVLLEKYLVRARHIEMQVFADRHGKIVHLFERDCSVQRRHQKVIEEAPAPGMEPLRRAQLGDAAIAAARAVGYVGAGTVEFIVAADGAFHFMEMNTRLQVEHGVTEMITGLDLVAWQLRVAAGEPLPLGQEQIAARGHALEARIYAEDPDRDFLPATGRLDYFSLPPASATLRIDTGVAAGDAISAHYDPMLAKLIAWGETRELARERLGAALAQLQIVGVPDNVQFLARLIATPAFAGADLDTTLIEREQARLFIAAAPAPAEAVIAAALATLARHARVAAAEAGARVWREARAWRLNAASEQQLQFRSGGAQLQVAVRFTSGGCELELDGVSGAVTLPDPVDGPLRVDWNGHSALATVVLKGEWLHVFLAGDRHVLQRVDPLAHVGEQLVPEGSVRASMPGRVVALLVEPGARVLRGQPLLILEAMKMEHTMCAPADGLCEAFNVAVGEQVSEGSELVRFAPASDPPGPA